MSERLGPPPVEALSDVGWARVERNVFSRMDGTVTNAVAAREVKREGRGNWIWLAVPAAAAAAFGLAFFSMKAPSQPAEGEPSRVVASDSPTTVSFGDAHITLQANTALIMDQGSVKPTAVLEHGTAVFAVAPTTTAIQVLAGDASARTAAAKFTITRKGERADITVETGTVDVRFRGTDVKLSADQTWTSDRPSEVVDLIESR